MSVIAVYLAVVTSILVSSGASTLLPAAAQQIGGMDIYSMAMTLSGVSSVALMPLYGYMGARYPAVKRPLFAASLLIAAVCIFLRGIAPTMWVIVIPSFFLGMYSPSIYILGYSMIRNMYDQKQAGVYLGIVGTMQSIGLLLGPVATGVLIQTAGWRVVNFAFFPLFAIAAILMFFGCKVTQEEVKSMSFVHGKFDYPGAFAVVMFLASLILALSLGQRAPFGSPLNNTLFIISAAAFIALILVIRKKGVDAFLPAPVLRDKNTLCLTAANFFSVFSSMAITFFLPMYIMLVMKHEPTAAGMSISVYAIAGLFMGPIFGRMIGKAGNARSVIMWGSGALRCLIQVAFMFLLTPNTSLWTIYGLMFIAGFYSVAGGVSPAVAPQIQIKAEIRQQGNSVIQLGQNFGGAVSIAVYTAVITAMGPEDGFPVGLAIAAVAAAIVFVVAIPLKRLEASTPSQSV
ncbi:MAG TPA: MFS transporter [Anaerovoracaceae bacterium]|nr:MFS transporter [Anaerovoracaceae bacterium]